MSDRPHHLVMIRRLFLVRLIEVERLTLSEDSTISWTRPCTGLKSRQGLT